MNRKPMRIITDQEIQLDIVGYRRRIDQAWAKLAELPGGMIPYSEHKRRESQRQEYLNDIEHYQRLIGYANEALQEEKP